jgi:hypothetical protein
MSFAVTFSPKRLMVPANEYFYGLAGFVMVMDYGKLKCYLANPSGGNTSVSAHLGVYQEPSVVVRFLVIRRDEG